MSETTVGMVRDELIQNVFVDGQNSTIINPSEKAIEQIVKVISESDNIGEIKIIVSEQTLKSLRRDFIVASKASEFIDKGILLIQAINNTPTQGTLIKTEETMRCIVDIDENMIITDGQEVYENVDEIIMNIWDDSEPISLRTPGLSNIYNEMRDEFGDEIADDYKFVIDNVTEFDNNMDEVAAALLVAARNEMLLYDISKWGEDVGLASKATFSRTKTRLEDNGYIQTEKVPIDVGRPRLRLKLMSNVYEEEYDGQVISLVQELL